MDIESNPTDPYEAVLADLHAQRDRIDQAIALLQNLRGNTAPTSPALPKSAPGGGVGPGAFLGMTIADAAKQLLAGRRRTMGNAEILEGLKSGGMVLTSADPMNTVGSILNRRFKEVGDVVRVDRGTWGLKEWYPNRNFGNGSGAKGGEQPSMTPEEAFGTAPVQLPEGASRTPIANPPAYSESFSADLDDEIPF